MDPSERPGAGPSEIARRVASEVSEIHRAIAELEEHVLELTPTSRARDPRRLETLQSIDALRQAAEGVATFLERWAGRLPDGPPVAADDLVAGLALRELGDRLRGAPASGAARGGELDLF